MNWVTEGPRRTLGADPRYAVEDCGPDGFLLFIDGFEVDSAESLESATAQLEARYEYEEHSADLALARTRLRQVRERLLDRFPHAARDGQLSSILEGLGDVLGTGPELDVSAAQPRIEPNIFAHQVTPDLAIVTDASQCIVAEVSDGTAGKVLRRVAITDVDALIGALGRALTAQATAMAGAWKQRQADPDEKRRAGGLLTRGEAVEWLMSEARGGLDRLSAVTLVDGVRRGRAESARLAGMTFDGTHWRVPDTTEHPAR